MARMAIPRAAAMPTARPATWAVPKLLEVPASAPSAPGIAVADAEGVAVEDDGNGGGVTMLSVVEA